MSSAASVPCCGVSPAAAVSRSAVAPAIIWMICSSFAPPCYPPCRRCSLLCWAGDVLNPQLRLVLIGAGSCPRSYLDAAAARGIRVSFGYGMTETSSGIAISVSGDPYALEICPDDTVTIAPDGEILVRSPGCMMTGYYRQPEETARVLKGGVLSTGDLGSIDENGRLHITGRKKEILVLKDGTKIFLPEYEGQLCRTLGTGELAVLAPDGVPVLLIQADPSSRSRIQNALRDLMSGYPRGQQLADIVFTDAPLPRTATGKHSCAKSWMRCTSGRLPSTINKNKDCLFIYRRCLNVCSL